MISMKIIIIILSLLTSSFAYADGIYYAPPTDKLNQLFGSLFGGLGVFAVGGSNPFISQISVLSEALMFLAGVITTYLILNALVKTAHQGEVSGKTIGEVWHIIRYVCSVALILPVINGYSSAQVIAASLVKQGIAISYHTANALFDDSSLKEISATNFTAVKINAVAHNLFLSFVCRYAFEEAYKKPVYVQTTGGVVPKFGITKETGIFADEIHIGEVGYKNGYNKDFCGSFSIPKFESKKIVTSDINQLSIAYKITQRNGVLSAKLFNDVDKAAKEFVEKKDISVYSKVLDAASEYSNNSSAYAYELVKDDNKNTQMREAVKIDGALYVGAYYIRMAKLQSEVNQALAKIPTATGIQKIPNAMIAETYLPYIKSIEEISKQNNLSMDFGINTIDGNQDSGWWSSIKGAVTTDPSIIVKRIVSSSIQPFTFSETDNFIMSNQKLGAWAIALAGAIFIGGALIVASPLGVHAGVVNIVDNITDYFVPSLFWLGGITFYITPMLAFYIYTGAMIVWICSAVATIIIANFICICMMLPGSDSMGQAANAFKQLLSILFKPALLVIAFTVSLVLTNVIGQAVMHVFMSVWNLAQDNSGVIAYLVSIIFFILSYVLFSNFLFFKIMTISLSMPDEMIGFIGGSGSVMGKEANTFANAGNSFGAGAAGGAAASVLSSRNGSNGVAGSGNGSDPLKGKGMGNVAPAGESVSNAGLNKTPSANSFSEVKKNSSSSTSDEAGLGDEPALDVDYSQQIEEFELGNKYDEAYQSMKEKKPDASHNEAANYAMDSAISWKYGAGSGKAVAAAGNGYYKNADSQMMLAMYRTAQEAGLSRNELKEISSKINDSDLKGDDAIKEFAVNFSQKINNKES